MSLGTSGGLTDYLSTSKLEGSLSISLYFTPHFPELLIGSLFCGAQGHCNTEKVWKARDTGSSVVSQHFYTSLLILSCQIGTRASVKAVNYQIVSLLHDTAGGTVGENSSLLIKCQICCCTTAFQMFGSVISHAFVRIQFSHKLPLIQKGFLLSIKINLCRSVANYSFTIHT